MRGRCREGGGQPRKAELPAPMTCDALGMQIMGERHRALGAIRLAAIVASQD